MKSNFILRKKGCPISKALTQKHNKAKQKYRFDLNLIKFFFQEKKEKKKHRSKTF